MRTSCRAASGGLFVRVRSRTISAPSLRTSWRFSEGDGDEGGCHFVSCSWASPSVRQSEGRVALLLLEASEYRACFSWCSRAGRDEARLRTWRGRTEEAAPLGLASFPAVAKAKRSRCFLPSVEGSRGAWALSGSIRPTRAC
ncbi:Hypothetical predicted protein [Podarcis lilfordi]|uniref:Uncharacterized protein n=1 Tax=Podarcis lilfordi TaxID=74358 RepID=A0AA35KJB5_9SAUR|nr:Hypothetical predicted protein [Podarcis lilfordi]